jgi:hypothetical protein
MASKRPIKVNPPVQADSQAHHDESWSIWAKRKYARYWFILFCFFIDIFVVLEVLRRDELPFRYGLAAALTMFLVLVEIYIHRKLWGQGGRWSDFDEDN